MSMHRKTITLTEQQNGWVKSRIESGQFGNDSEYIRHLIRQDQQAQERLATLRRALVEGEKRRAQAGRYGVDQGGWP